MDKTQAKNILNFVETFPLKAVLQGTTFLITGVTGLIGSTLIRCLVAIKKH